MSFRPTLRIAATLLLALAAAALCTALRTPLPWMIGPLLAVSIASMAGAPTASHVLLRNAGQWVIGTALGLYFTREVTVLVAGVWWAIALSIAWALFAGWAFGRCLWCWNAKRLAHVPGASMRATTYFAGAIGGASEMALLAERAGARTDLVAAAHSLRVVMVTVSIPFALQWAGVHGTDAFAAPVRELHWDRLAWLGAAAAAGGWLMRAAGRNNPWFLGPLVVAAAFTLLGLPVSGIPGWVSNAAQLVIGASLGVRFSREFLHAAPRWLGSVAVGTLGLILASAAFGGLLASLTGLPAATLVLSTSPGGIAEMAITAKVLQLGVPVVTAFQVCRLVAVLLLVGPIFRRLEMRHRAPDAATPAGVD